jgi:hypothetical protein
MMQDANRQMMSYLDSSHFSDKLSYRKHFILTYDSKDMNLARYKHFSGIFTKQRNI